MTELQNNGVKVILKPGREKSVLNRHPWVFSGAILKVEGRFEAGDIVAVYSAGGQLLGRGFLNPASDIRVRMLSFSAEETIDAGFFRHKLQRAIRLRRQIFDEQTNVYRLVHADGDFLPGLIVDHYAGHLVVQFNALGTFRLRGLMQEILQELVAPLSILDRSERRALRREGLSAWEPFHVGETPPVVEVRENGLRFRVDLQGGQKTGFFIDQRENRKMLGERASGRKVLNCFAYSGGFSVYAARQGATVTSVEIHKGALELARENFALNNLDAAQHRFCDANVFDFLRSADSDFDVIVLDPPAFARERQKLQQAARGYKDINRLAISLVKNGGLVLTCSCSGFVSWDLFQKIVFSAAQEAGRDVQILDKPAQPADHPLNIYHPEGEYLKTLLLRVAD